MKAHVETDEQYQKRINSKYEYKLVNIGEEVDNRIRELEIEVKDIRKANDNLTRANESYRQENIEMRKENYGVEVAMLTKKVDDLEKENKDAINEGVYLRNENEGYLEEIKELKKRNTFLEKLHSQHRYVFSEIPNTEENMKMVKLMKKHINKRKYTMRWRGQYLIDGEDWRKYQMGQPLSKSKCIRVYIDNKPYQIDNVEGFNAEEVDVILGGLYKEEDQSEEFITSFEVKGEENGEIDDEKRILDVTKQLINYFKSMKLHFENSASKPIKDNVNIVIPKGDKQCHTK